MATVVLGGWRGMMKRIVGGFLLGIFYAHSYPSEEG